MQNRKLTMKPEVEKIINANPKIKALFSPTIKDSLQVETEPTPVIKENLATKPHTWPEVVKAVYKLKKENFGEKD